MSCIRPEIQDINEYARESMDLTLNARGTQFKGVLEDTPMLVVNGMGKLTGIAEFIFISSQGKSVWVLHYPRKVRLIKSMILGFYR